ncbi:MAG TPA: hypothetical protein VMG31_04035 [Verrucomicrobiae bacterium]|nr:hypothetical protein [Verrucomicrobiae bacterium]
MNSKSLRWAINVLSILALVSATGALAQDRPPAHFRGLINDYSPSTVKGGPYEIRGNWSLELHRRSGSADFSAVLNMETSDYGIAEGIVDPTQPVTRGAHTHHIKLTNATVTWSMDGCPTFNPATTNGFQVNGTVSLMTGNGSNAPFETDPPSSTLQVCVTGGSGDYSIPYSNVTLVLAGPAAKHFGTQQAIHGFVRTAD